MAKPQRDIKRDRRHSWSGGQKKHGGWVIEEEQRNDQYYVSLHLEAQVGSDDTKERGRKSMNKVISFINEKTKNLF